MPHPYTFPYIRNPSLTVFVRVWFCTMYFVKQYVINKISHNVNFHEAWTATLAINPLSLLPVPHERLHNFQVGLTSTRPTTATDPQQSPHVVCLNYTGAFPFGRDMLKCNKTVRGRYLFIQIMDRNSTNSYLTLCEVEIYCECCWWLISPVHYLLQHQLIVISRTS